MDAGIDYTTEDVPERVAEITGGKGVDLVFEHVGGELFGSPCSPSPRTGGS